MKISTFFVAASLCSVALQGCGSSGGADVTSEKATLSVVRPATDETTFIEPSAKISFSLHSNMIAAKEVYGVRFTFALPEGLEPAVVLNPSCPQCETVELDREQITLTGACSGAVAMASYRERDRKVEVALIDADGLEATGTALGTIAFTATAPGTLSAGVGLEGIVLQEVIGLEHQLPVSVFTLSAETTRD